LDDVVPEAMLDHVRLVKIDVEGAELDVLLGMGRFMPRLSRSTFVVEITQTYLAQLGASAKEVYEFFDRHGFRPDGEPNRLPQYDEVFHPARC
jgi:hypothetical protein